MRANLADRPIWISSAAAFSRSRYLLLPSWTTSSWAFLFSGESAVIGGAATAVPAKKIAEMVGVSFMAQLEMQCWEVAVILGDETLMRGQTAGKFSKLRDVTAA